jgi:hypothetical protein
MAALGAMLATDWANTSGIDSTFRCKPVGLAASVAPGGASVVVMGL